MDRLGAPEYVTFHLHQISLDAFPSVLEYCDKYVVASCSDRVRRV